MHLLVRETRTLDEQAQADDLGMAPADLLVLSFSDSDLASLAAAHDASLPTLRLAPLARLRHPMSVDLFLDNTARGASCVFVRLLGGLEYWRYGAEELAALCRREKIGLAMVPGDARDDPLLAELSTVPPAMLARLDGFMRQGGPRNHRAALDLLAHLAGRAGDGGAMPEPVPAAGIHRPARGDGRPLASLVFYRAHLMAGDLAPFDTLADALDARGLDTELLHAASLKDPDAAGFIAGRLRHTAPAVVLNATFFAVRGEGSAASPLDASGAPVLQLLQPVGGEPAWRDSRRGLSQTDLAMQLVLPEFDGRLAGTAISFKGARTAIASEAPGQDGFAASVNLPYADGIALVADRAAGWARLAATPAADRRVAIMLSDYPAVGGQIAQAVGLDSFASLSAILRALQHAGYRTGTLPEQASLVAALCHDAPAEVLSRDAYRALFATLPQAVREASSACWGEPDQAIGLRHVRLGNVLVVVQPDRGAALDRKAGYHDPDLWARHDYLGAYLWLRQTMAIDALVHLGTHGTLEWLPGKAAAPSPDCLPAALLRGLPVIYPFIVNNPGEAAAAKRRLGAVTIGHLTPPFAQAAHQGEALALERLIDDYAAADGLDQRRVRILRGEILERAEACGLLAESGVRRIDGGDAEAEAQALARLDAYLCDVKELQIRDGLHVFGAAPRGRDALLAQILRASPDADPALVAAALDGSATGEIAGLLAALDGRFVPPGPSGAPSRGRADVLPTGRNLASADPRAIPTRSAMVLAEKAAQLLLDRHRQDHGDWLRTAMIDLWGSTSLRTGGEDFGLALTLMGVKPVWDQGSGRVSGFEIVPLAVLDRPRVDVTLRLSGFFRDAFAGQIALFDQAVAALADRVEDPGWNRLAAAADGLSGAARLAATARIFGPAPGCYGTGLEDRLARGGWSDRDALAGAYLDGGAHAYGPGRDGAADRDGFAARVAGAEALVHLQDHAETDLLDGIDFAAFEGGFAAASAACGGDATLYHADSSAPGTPRVRLLAEEVVRVVRGRAANPDWIAGMARHGYRGAAEIARTVEALHGFAALLPDRFDRQFELLFDATLGDPAIDRFLAETNQDARRAMRARFDEARRRGLWRPRRNDLDQSI